MLKTVIYLILFINIAQASIVGLDQKDESRLVFFMSRQQEIVQRNHKNLRRLMKRLQKGQIIGLELIVAAASKSKIESRFGHTMLRFVDNHGSAGDDIILSFVADLDSPKLSGRKGVFGGYPVYPLFKTFRMINKDYINDGDRVLERHIISSSKEMRTDLINALQSSWVQLQKSQKNLDYKQSLKAKKALTRKANQILKNKSFEIVALKDMNSSTVFAWKAVDSITKEIKVTQAVKLKLASIKVFGKYKFLSNNCAGALINFLKSIQFPNRGRLLFAGRIPVKISTYFEKSLLSFLPSKQTLNIRQLKIKIKNKLSMSLMDIEDPKKWPKDAAEVLVAFLSIKEKIQLLNTMDSAPVVVTNILIKDLPGLKQRPSYDQVYEIQEFPSLLYGLCADKICAKKYTTLTMKFWNEEQIKAKRLGFKKLMKKLKKDKLKKSLKLRPKVVQHFKIAI